MKKMIICCISCAVVLMAGIIFTDRKSADSEDVYESTKEIVEDYLEEDQQDSSSQKVVASGDDFEITKAELEFRLQGKKKSNANQTAEEVLQELIEERILMKKAEEAQCVVSEQDAEAQVAELKDIMEKSDDSGQKISEMIESFKDQDAYWDYTKERIIIKGSINNYREKLSEECKKQDAALSDEEIAGLVDKKVKDMVSEEAVKINEKIVRAIK